MNGGESVSHIAQLFGFAAIGCSLLIYSRKKRGSILGFKLVQDVCWAMHYLLLGAFSAMATNLICALREVAFRSKRERISRNVVVFAGFLLFYALSAVVTWQNAFSILPACSSIFSTVAFRIRSPRKMKLLAIPSSLCTLAYNIAVSHSVSVYVGVTFTLSTLAASLIGESLANQKRNRLQQSIDKKGE